MHRTNAVVTSGLDGMKAGNGMEVGGVGTWTREVFSSSDSWRMSLGLLGGFCGWFDVEVVGFLFLRAGNGLSWECGLVFGGWEEVGGLACVWGCVWVYV